ncbi:sel1 repeat family protein [Pseudoxanthomonas gei]|uniref:Sel1 repeat family protein n=1 Tax=Pseudoxanthomonas gei TaxID=1383030 RepID=A0ABX0ACX8_9GAMM|nr:sel1 repeat family protein [Pseudoxanthomonas gei]NDK39434.1 sel1 repeat family protein [Pseudoxanthomonas gei]
MKLHQFTLLALAMASGPVLAGVAEAPPPFKAELEQPMERPRQGNYVGEAGIPANVMTEGFLSAHPDLRWRREALHAYTNKRYDEAMQYFLRSARYADKPAQAMIAEMHWKGIGVPQDRALGYAWMDLAAERFYSNFVIKREQYWGTLSEAEQRDAIARGQSLLVEYGDAAAKPRMAKILRKQRMTSGSRVGFVGNLQIIPFTGPDAGSGMTIRGDEYYAPKYWRAEEYFKWQDEVWDAPGARKGKVQVGELESADKPAPAAKDPP